jgi:murein DD-endopeptidase MepM/ murein hydrolase activator NlpD
LCVAVRSTIATLACSGVLLPLVLAAPTYAQGSGGSTAPSGDTPGTVVDPARAGGTSYGTDTEAERQAAKLAKERERARARAKARALARSKARALARARARARAKEKARREKEQGSSGGGGFRLPLSSGYTLTSTFWESRSYENHPGVDLATDTGTPIYAVGAGTVTQAGSVGGYGNYTCIAHTSVVSSCYAHQSSLLVRQGDRVSKGRLIGKVGSTGNSTGPHLHFEIRVNGDVRCPAPWVGASSSQWCEAGSPGYGSTSTRSVAARTASGGPSIWRKIAAPRGDAAD